MRLANLLTAGLLVLSASLFAEEIGWRPEVMEAIDAMIAQNKSKSAKPVAVFDWDNTTAKNDVGDAVFFAMLDRDLIFVPPNDDLTRVSSFFTQDAIAAVKKACTFVERKKKSGYLLSGRFYKTSGETNPCRREWMSIYRDEITTNGKIAFDQGPKAYNRRTIKPSYLWITQLFAGMTREDVFALTNEVLDQRTSPQAKAKRRENVDGIERAAFLEIYEPIVALMDKLLSSGFEVWIVSASHQYVVETFARRLDTKLGGRLFKQNIRNQLESEAARRTVPVIGVQMVSESGDKAKQTLAHLGLTLSSDGPVLVNRARGCGTAGENEIITYVEGKSCFINLGIGKRPVFAAGDATTDVAMLQMASSLALVINRGYDELMCNAYQSPYDGKKWVVQPMFIDPCGKHENGYECRCKARDGTASACINERGSPLAPLVQDNVFVAAGEGKVGLDCH